MKKSFITWLDPSDCNPPHGLDLSPGSRDTLKVEDLESQFCESGFDKTKSALVGYPLEGKIQLLSGTHRHEAAVRAGIKLPVTLFLRSYVEAYWGTEMWPTMLQDISVSELLSWDTGESLPPPTLIEQEKVMELFNHVD